MKIKKAIVTGGAGFIGSHICEYLVKQGVDVISLDNYLSGNIENYESFKNEPNFTYYDCDISDAESLYGLYDNFCGTDVIFHEAAAKKVASLKNPKIDKAVNIDGTWNMLNLAVKIGCKKFLHASTGSIYGEATVDLIDESHPLDPVSYYGVSKLAGEKYVNLYNKLHGLNTTIFRYSSVYGTRQRTDGKGGGVISIFIERAHSVSDLIIYGDGKQTRCFTHVDDVVNANMVALRDSKSNGKVYNLAGDTNYSINEVADIVSNISEYDINKVYTAQLIDDVKYYNVDNSLIKKELGIVFKTNLKKDIERLYNGN